MRTLKTLKYLLMIVVMLQTQHNFLTRKILLEECAVVNVHNGIYKQLQLLNIIIRRISCFTIAKIWFPSKFFRCLFMFLEKLFQLMW
jgi:hypothetical protein